MRALAALSLFLLAGCFGAAVQQRGDVILAQSFYDHGDWASALHQVEIVIVDGRAARDAQLQAYYIKAQILEDKGRTREAAGLYEYLSKNKGGPKARDGLAAVGGPVCPAPKQASP
jgi:hypothetical protein